MKWVGDLNHNMQHITSENPSQCPTVTTVCETKHIQFGVASIWPLLDKVEGAETLYICTKKTSYEYEVYEVQQS
jgi:hypothetical protein